MYQAVNNVPLTKPVILVTGKHNNTPHVEELFPQSVFQLDTGDHVAMNYSQKLIPARNMLSCRIVAWLVDSEGDPQAINGDDAIHVDFKHSAPISQVEEFGTDGIAAALRDMVLGEHTASIYQHGIAPDMDILDSINIRYSIIGARIAGDVIDLKTVQAPEPQLPSA